MSRHLKMVLPLALVFGATALPSFAAEQTTWRLFVADQAEPTIRALDPQTGKVLDTFKLKAPAGLSVSDSGKTIFAVERDGAEVAILSTGIAIEDHGSHGDLRVEAPRLLDFKLEGQRPSHFVDHNGNIAQFFDGDGVVKIVRESEVLDGKAGVRTVKLASPHHGVAISYGDDVLVTEPHPEKPTDELPIGIKVLDKNNAAIGSLHECPDLHGEASSGNVLAIACKTGLLLVKAGADGPEIEHLAYSKSLPDGKSTSLLGGKGLQYFLGNYGPQAVVLVESGNADPFRLVELPARRVHFAVDSARPQFAYIFTEDGQLHQLNIVTGKISKSIKLTEPYSMDGHWNLPRPRIAVAGDEIVVSDPLKSKLHVINAAKFEKDREIAVEGKPYNVVAVGGSGEIHE
ncbi:metallochaperone AztD [Phyllobacterium sp. 628]|uniref:zinc metallochaperone AztD n=1 Tax=Phyllobacterium sp. 628 TaxID=2718938 RepID=UPI001662881E|nr:zinc metallochaperone AztD [Phyllobacterium sp. 628]QND53926.1 metallochaperone AztD [Phyllobacterium sp. 628]